MSRAGVGRNEPCPCGSGRKFKQCCLRQASGPAGYFADEFASPTAFTASPLRPSMKVKVFLSERWTWQEARLRDVRPGQEFISGDRLFKVHSSVAYAENPVLDISKIPKCDQPYDPETWRTPDRDDVVCVFDRQDPDSGHWLMCHVQPRQRFMFQRRIYYLEPHPRRPHTGYLIDTGQVDRSCAELLYVWVEYTCSDALGKAKIGYRYRCGRRIPLTNGQVVPAEGLTPGMQFLLEDGGVATVTKVDPPKPWQPNSEFRDPYGNAFRRVIGTFKYTGWVPIMTVKAGGGVHRVTPGHPYWSESRRGWYPIGSFVPGELVLTREKQPVPIEAIASPQWMHETVYNVEVDEYHTYFVGAGKTSVWVHNGMGEGCRVPRAAREEALETGAITRTSRARAGVLTEGELNPQHHIFPQARRRWFAERGIDVDQYTARIPRDLHETLHSGGGPGRGGGWYNDEVMNVLRAREQALGRRLTPWEIEEHGIQFMQRFGFGNAWVLPYGG